jgi:peptidoglycan/xylan/chitin deacetylase (PgdA/CDA1 family)
MTNGRGGAFTLSLDFELIWGTLDLVGPEGFRAACERERADVIPRLLELLDQFEIQATWCVLGHVMLRGCRPVDGRKHPEIVRPSHASHEADWFVHDPCSDEDRAPVFYGRSLVEDVMRCRTPQEIGCHSFSHVVFGDPGCSREAAASELAACLRIADEIGAEMRSFAFPRNLVGHLDLLREHGFRCFRGPEPTWHQGGGQGIRTKRVGHLFDVVTARRPPVVGAQRTPEGIVNIPGSMVFFPMHGRRRHIPVRLRVRRAVAGLERAVREQRVFHLWFHPTNLADEPDAMFSGLEQVFERVSSLRRAGRLEVLPMKAYAARA